MALRRGLVWLTPIALVLIWLAAGSASATTMAVACGSEVIEDTVLRDDLLNCETGLTITAPNISLNLNGHQIRGRGAGEGVRVSASGVEVKGGVISGFGVGIVAFGEHGLRIQDNTIHHNQTGVELFLAIGAEVVRNRILNNAAGLHTVLSDGSLLQRNIVKGNRRDGALLVESTAIVSENTFSSNGGDGLEIDEICYPGVALYRVESNVSVGNAALGMNLHFGGCPPPSEPDLLDDLDAGRNSAASNGDARECLLVSCVRNKGQALTP
jgi:parallel beta-helix repeat protein